MKDQGLKDISFNLHNAENFDPQLNAYTPAIPAASNRLPLRDITPKSPKVKRTTFLLTNAALKGRSSVLNKLRWSMLIFLICVYLCVFALVALDIDFFYLESVKSVKVSN